MTCLALIGPHRIHLQVDCEALRDISDCKITFKNDQAAVPSLVDFGCATFRKQDR
jgi:hypothetical protein